MSAVCTAAASSGRPRYARGSTALVVAASTAVAAPAVVVAAVVAAVARAGTAVVVEIVAVPGPAVVDLDVLVVLGITRAAVVDVLHFVLDLVVVLVDGRRGRRRN